MLQNEAEIPPPAIDTAAVEGLILKLKNYLYQYYEPATSPEQAAFHYTTKEVWRQLLRIYPNEALLTEEMVATWLHTGGFSFFDFGNMRFEWLINRKD